MPAWLLVLVLLAALFVLTRSKEAFEAVRVPTIFVNIAAFRDSECSATLQDIFSQATNPERVTVGVCQQNDSGHPAENCLADSEWQKNVKTISFPQSAAKGPTWARYWAATLLTDEDYYFCIDSHTHFEKDWDEELIRQHTAAIARSRAAGGSEKVVLSTYPRSHDHPQQTQVPALCKSKWNEDGVPVLESKYQPPDGRRVPFIAGGMMFAPAQMVRDVPYDAALPYLFQSEELLLSARLFTSGYDVYTPTSNVISHHYSRPDAPKFWSEKTIDQAYASRQRAQSVEKVKYILGLTSQPPAFMHDNKLLGSVRTIQAFWEFSGLDPVNKTSKTDQLFCP